MRPTTMGQGQLVKLWEDLILVSIGTFRLDIKATKLHVFTSTIGFYDQHKNHYKPA